MTEDRARVLGSVALSFSGDPGRVGPSCPHGAQFKAHFIVSLGLLHFYFPSSILCTQVSISYIGFKKYFIYLFMYVCVCIPGLGVGMMRSVLAMANKRRSEDKLRKSVLSFYHVDCEDHTQVIRLS